MNGHRHGDRLEISPPAVRFPVEGLDVDGRLGRRHRVFFGRFQGYSRRLSVPVGFGGRLLVRGNPDAKRPMAGMIGVFHG